MLFIGAILLVKQLVANASGHGVVNRDILAHVMEQDLVVEFLKSI
jgi:hypothetical protein